MKKEKIEAAYEGKPISSSDALFSLMEALSEQVGEYDFKKIHLSKKSREYLKLYFRMQWGSYSRIVLKDPNAQIEDSPWFQMINDNQNPEPEEEEESHGAE